MPFSSGNGLLAGLLGSLIGVYDRCCRFASATAIINGIEKGDRISFSGDIYFIDFLPSELHWLDVAYVLVTALLLSLLASWYPRGGRATLTLRESIERPVPRNIKQGAVMYYGFDIGGTKDCVRAYLTQRGGCSGKTGSHAPYQL